MTKRDVERRIERIDEGRDYPKLSLCTLIAADELETVDKKRGLVRVGGTVYNGSELREALAVNP